MDRHTFYIGQKNKRIIMNNIHGWVENDRSFKRWCSFVTAALCGWSQCLYLGEGWLPQAQKIFDDLTPLAQHLTSCLSKQGETSKMKSGSSLLRHYGYRVENWIVVHLGSSSSVSKSATVLEAPIMTGKQDSSFEFMDRKCPFSVLHERGITWSVIKG